MGIKGATKFEWENTKFSQKSDGTGSGESADNQVLSEGVKIRVSEILQRTEQIKDGLIISIDPMEFEPGEELLVAQKVFEDIKNKLLELVEDGTIKLGITDRNYEIVEIKIRPLEGMATSTGALKSIMIDPRNELSKNMEFILQNINKKVNPYGGYKDDEEEIGF